MKEEEFKKLVEELKNGNNQSLKVIFEDHSEFCIQNLLRRTTCSFTEAEDIFMDAVLNFREKIVNGKIRYITRIRNYIYTTCLNMYRVRYSQQVRALDKRDEVIMYFQGESSYQEQDVSEDDHRKDLVIRAFQNLDPRCQCILKSYYVNSRNMSEIAEQMGFTNANVAKTTKSRCYKRWMKEIDTLIKSNAKVISVK